ncbi:sulfurtransferase TusA family protein, partial [Verrucomicrobiota bacterium]
SHLEHFVACAGASTCRLGLCLSRGAAEACSEALHKRGVDHAALRAVDINISGCPNACGHHPVASIGLFGAAQRSEGRLVPAYRVVLGAQHINKEARLARSAGTVPARSLPDFIAHLAEEFARDRTQDETFTEYFDRKGEIHFQQLVERHAAVPPYPENPDFYRDWGQGDDFSLAGRGAGECGAGVFEVVREDIVTARKALELVESGREEHFSAFLPTIRALLITRGVDAQDTDQIIRSFESHFVDTGLVSSEFRALLALARDHVGGTADALDGKQDELCRLLDRVELLFSTMDASLQFHPPEANEAPAPAEKPEQPDPTPHTQAETLDLSGVACPMNFVKAKLKLETMGIGEKLKIVLDEGEPVQNVPASFRNEGQDILAISALDDGHWRVVVQKKK